MPMDRSMIFQTPRLIARWLRCQVGDWKRLQNINEHIPDKYSIIMSQQNLQWLRYLLHFQWSIQSYSILVYPMSWLYL